jgi:PDZ domain
MPTHRLPLVSVLCVIAPISAASANSWCMAAYSVSRVQPAIAVDESAAGPKIDDLIADLGDPDPATRVIATVDLEASPAITLKDLEAAMARADLNAEQSRRLRQAAEIRFIREPRAAVGVTYNMQAQDREGIVLIDAIEPTFPAAAVLKAGDRIEMIDGVKLSAASPMRPLIFSRDPGDEIPMTIVREGVTLNVVVKLGDWTRLQSIRNNFNQRGIRSADFHEADLERAWRYRSARYDRGREWRVIEAVVPKLPEEAQPAGWAGEGLDVDHDGFDDGGESALVAGGQAHGGLGRETPMIDARARINHRDRLASRDDPQELVKVLRQHQMQRNQIEAECRDLRVRLMQPGLLPVEERQLRESLAINEARLTAHRREIDAAEERLQALGQLPKPVPRRR